MVAAESRPRIATTGTSQSAANQLDGQEIGSIESGAPDRLLHMSLLAEWARVPGES